MSAFVHRDAPLVLCPSNHGSLALSLTSPVDLPSSPSSASSTAAVDNLLPSSFTSSNSRNNYHYPPVPLHQQDYSRHRHVTTTANPLSASRIIHPQQHSPSLSPDSSSRIYSFYPSSTMMNGTSPPDDNRLLSSTPTKMGQMTPQLSNSLSIGSDAGETSTSTMRPRAATVSAGGSLTDVNPLMRSDTGTNSLISNTGSSNCPGVTPVKKASRRNPWGPETYSDLITVAIHSYPDQQATLQQIYDFIIANYEYFRDRSDPTSSAGWKNSIRHNLSLHDRFTKCPKSADNTKSSYWRINSEVATKPYVRRRACSIDNANLKRSTQNSSTSGSRSGSGHNRSTVSNSTTTLSNGSTVGSSGGRGIKASQCLSNRSPPLPMLCEVLTNPQPPNHSLGQHPSSENVSAVEHSAVVSAVASSHLNYSPNSGIGFGGTRRPTAATLDDRVSFLGHNMMLLGGGNCDPAGGSCWRPGSTAPKLLDACTTAPYDYLQHQQELVSATPCGSFPFPAAFGGSGSTDQSFRSRTNGLIEQLLRVDDSPLSLNHPLEPTGAVGSAYLLPDNLGPNTVPPYFPNSFLAGASTSSVASDLTCHQLQQHHQPYEHFREHRQHLPMQVDTQHMLLGRGGNALTGSSSPVTSLKQELPHLRQQNRVTRSPTASVVHHHPHRHQHHAALQQHLHPVSLQSVMVSDASSSMHQSPTQTGFSPASSSSPFSWTNNGIGVGAVNSSGIYQPTPAANTANHGGTSRYGQSTTIDADRFLPFLAGGNSHRQYTTTGLGVNFPWSSTSNCEGKSDQYVTMDGTSRGLMTDDPTGCPDPILQARNKTSPINSFPISSSGGAAITYYRRGLSLRDSTETRGHSNTPPPLEILKMDDKNNVSGGRTGKDLSPPISTASGVCLSADSFQQQSRLFQPIDESAGGHLLYPTMRSDEGEQQQHGLTNSSVDYVFDAQDDDDNEQNNSSKGNNGSRSLEMKTEDVNAVDCESLELQLSLELAGRIVGSSCIGR